MYKKLFLPSPVQKKRALLVQPKMLVGYCLLLVAFSFISLRTIVKNPDVLGYATNVSVSELLADTNKMRVERGLESLSINEQLSKAAAAKAKDMFEDDYWAHTAPDGTEPWDFIDASGYKYSYAGENLAVDFANSSSVVNAWYDSPTHRDNLLNKNYTEIGFAVVDGELNGRKTTLVVQMFGRPRYISPNLAAAKTEPLESVVIPAPAAALETNNEPVTETIEEDLAYQLAFEQEPVELAAGSVLNAEDVFSVSKYIAILLGLFISIAFAVDGYVVRRLGMLRVSGHTILHIAVLILAIFGIWYTNIGLVL